jgi:PKD domain/Fibronectin type III domain
MKRIVVFLTVWAMTLAGALASVAFLPSSASAQPAVALAAATVPGSSYTPLPTARVFDGTATTTPRRVQIAGLGGVPADATAVMVNTEVFAPTAAGYVRVTPAGLDPGVTTQEFAKGQAISNLVAVKLVGGKIQVKVSAGSARILMDVSGYYSTKAGTYFAPLPTARVFDGTATTTPRQVQIAGLGGVPADATAVMVNTEVFAPTAAGYVRVTPAGLNPGVAVQEFAKGQAISNLVAVKLVGGKIQVKVSAGSARILMDVSGYYSAKAGTYFAPLAPARVFDGTATTTPRQVQIAGLGGVPADATAAMVNTEVFAPTAAGYVRVTPAGLNPGVAVQQFAKGQAISNLVAVKLVGGKIQVKVSAGSARILMDVSAYYGGTLDVTPPGPVTGLTAAAASDTSIRLDWTNPAATDFTGVTIRRALGATAPATATSGTSIPVPASATAKSFTDTGLTAGTQYSYAVFAHDGSGNNAVAAKVTATTTKVDVTAPGPVTALAATVVSDTSIKLNWANPADADFTGVTIRRLTGTIAPTVTTGTLVTDTAKATTSYTDTGLTAGTQYSYAAFAHDGSGNFANAATLTVTTTTTTSQPTAVLTVNSSLGLTAKSSVGGFTSLFDVSGSLAGSGATLVSALLNYGDGTAPVSFSGDPTTWSENHGFATVGDKAVTVVVTNSAGATATDAVKVTVYPSPTATIKVVGPVVLGQPVTFDVTSLTPAGTVFTDSDFCFDGTAGPIWDHRNGLPTTTTTHIFTAPGTYDAEFYVYNDADGRALASVVVTVTTVDTTPPAPVTALTAAVGADSVALAWANPADADYTGVMIRRLAGAIAPTRTTGILVTDTANTASSFTDTGLTVGTQYSYAAFAHDGSGNYAAAATVTGTTLAALPTAVLSINGSTSATASTSVGGYKPFFDMSGSQAGAGTLVSALLNFGDGTTQNFTSADPAWSSEHVYATSGNKAVTVVVTNSAGDTATAAILVTVFAAPTAMITAPRIARPGDPVTLALTSSTPAGTVFTDYDLSYDNGVTWDYISGVPPTTLTHTFSAEGMYTVLLNAYNDADGYVLSSAKVRVDVTPPAPVTNLVVSVVSVGDTFLSLSWKNPTDADYTGVMIRRQLGASAPATVNDGDLVSDFNDLADYVINPGLTPGTQYSYAAFAHDGSGNYAAGVNVSGTTTGTAPNTTPPGPVTTLSAVAMAGDTSIKLAWVNPNDSDFAGVTIRRADGATAPTSATTGDPVTISASSTARSFTDTGLTPGTEYSYAVFSYDTAGNHAAAAKVTETTTKNTTAGLVVDTKVTVGTEVFFDPASSYAATGATLTGTLDYGDGTPLDSFSGDPVDWAGFHTYAVVGAQTVTLTVTDSTNKIVTKVVTMNIFDPPTASMPATAQAQVGVPFTFLLTTTTPAGTTFQGWSLYGDWMAGDYGAAPPATLTHTFTAAGTYTFMLTVTNDAQGVAESTPMVVTVQ